MSLRDFININNDGFRFNKLDLNQELNFNNTININGDGLKIDTINKNNQSNFLVYNNITKDINYSSIAYGDFINITPSIDLIADTPLSIPYTNAEINLNVITDPINPSRIVFLESGNYKIGTSIQFLKNAGGDIEIDIWFRKNNNDINNSASAINLSGGAGARNFSYVELIESFNTNDWVEVVVGTSSADISIISQNAQLLPFPRPSIPSIISTCYKLN